MNRFNQLLQIVKLNLRVLRTMLETILKRIRVPERLQFGLFLLAIFFSPFYLIFKMTVWSDTPLWMLHGGIVTFLFVILLVDRIAKPQNNNAIVRSRFDKLVALLLVYFIWLAVFGVINGSAPANITRVFWQFIIGVMVYFVAKRHLSEKRLKILEIIIWTTFLIVIALFFAEIITVNFLGKKSFFWSLAFFEQGLQERAHISYGGASLSWLAFRRITGFFGNHAVAATFISIGAVFPLCRILIRKCTVPSIMALAMALFTLIFTCSRFPVIGFVVALIIGFVIAPIPYKKRMIVFLIVLLAVFMVAVSFSGSNAKYLLKTMYFEKTVQDIFYGDTIFGTAGRYVERDWSIMKDRLWQKPLLLITGSGFGYFDETAMSIGGEFGWLIMFCRIGLIGFILIGLVMARVIRKVKDALHDPQMNNNEKYLMLACQSYMITAIIATFHSGAMFHSANYLFFFLCLAIIAHLDEKRKIDYNIGNPITSKTL